MQKKFDKKPIAWITRGGKHIPIFEDKNQEEKEILERLPMVDIGQITKDEKRILERLLRQNKIRKVKWYWNNMGIGKKKTWYFLIDAELDFS